MDSTLARIVAFPTGDGRALVEVDTSVACSRCAAGRGCGAGLISGRSGSRRIEANVAAGIEVAAGDTVTIDIPGKSLLAAAAIVYGLPLSGAAAGAAIAYLTGTGDAATALGSLAGMAAGFAVSRRRLAQTDCLTRFVPTVSGRAVDDGVAG